MATQLQFRRGTSAQNDAFTGAAGEVVIDTQSRNLRVHDGATAGGYEIIPSGSIVAQGWTGSTVGWQLCNGAAISRTTYARLFSRIGTSYGVGDGSTTFNVPDLRNKIPLGTGTNHPTMGAAGTPAAAGGTMTSAAKTDAATNSTTQTVTPGFVNVAGSAKDSALTSVVNSVNTSAHTHTIASFTINTSLPYQVVNWVIKE